MIKILKNKDLDELSISYYKIKLIIYDSLFILLLSIYPVLFLAKAFQSKLYFKEHTFFIVCLILLYIAIIFYKVYKFLILKNIFIHIKENKLNVNELQYKKDDLKKIVIHSFFVKFRNTYKIDLYIKNHKYEIKYLFEESQNKEIIEFFKKNISNLKIDNKYHFFVKPWVYFF